MAGGRCLGLAFVSAIAFSREALGSILRCQGGIGIILFGDLYLDWNGQELHFGRFAHF